MEVGADDARGKALEPSTSRRPADAPKKVCASLTVRRHHPDRLFQTLISPQALFEARKALFIRNPTSHSVKTLVDECAFPSLHAHLDLERAWTQQGQLWVVPPTSHHADIRAFLETGDDSGLTLRERGWVRQHWVRETDREMMGCRRELYLALVRMHGKKHRKSPSMWEILRQQYLGPLQRFIAEWVKLCPTCLQDSET